MDASGSAGTINIGVQNGENSVDISSVSFSDKFTQAVLGEGAKGSSDAAVVTVSGALMTKLLTGSITGDSYDKVVVSGSEGLSGDVDLSAAGSVAVDLNGYTGASANAISKVTVGTDGNVILTPAQFALSGNSFGSGSTVQLSASETIAANSAAKAYTLKLADGENTVTGTLAKDQYLDVVGGNGTDSFTFTVSGDIFGDQNGYGVLTGLSIDGENSGDTVVLNASALTAAEGTTPQINIGTLSLANVNFSVSGATGTTTYVEVSKGIDIGDNVDLDGVNFFFNQKLMTEANATGADLSKASGDIWAQIWNFTTDNFTFESGTGDDTLVVADRSAGTNKVILAGGKGADILSGNAYLMFTGVMSDIVTGKTYYAECKEDVSNSEDAVPGYITDLEFPVSGEVEGYFKKANLVNLIDYTGKGSAEAHVVLSSGQDTIMLQDSVGESGNQANTAHVAKIQLDNFRVGQDHIVLFTNGNGVSTAGGEWKNLGSGENASSLTWEAGSTSGEGTLKLTRYTNNKGTEGKQDVEIDFYNLMDELGVVKTLGSSDDLGSAFFGVAWEASEDTGA